MCWLTITSVSCDHITVYQAPNPPASLCLSICPLDMVSSAMLGTQR